MKKKLLIAAGILVSVLLLISLADSFNHNYSDSPKDSDLIVMIGGDTGRLKRAAELYADGYADYVMITPVINIPGLEQNIAAAADYGIPESALIADYTAESTYTNATAVIDYIEENNMTSALIATSDYHIKRTKYIFEKENDGRFTFKYVAALSKNGDRWYDTSDSFFIWWSEYIKIWWYRFGLYRFTG